MAHLLLMLLIYYKACSADKVNQQKMKHQLWIKEQGLAFFIDKQLKHLKDIVGDIFLFSYSQQVSRKDQNQPCISSILSYLRILSLALSLKHTSSYRKCKS